MVKILTVGHACVDFVHGVTDHLNPNVKLDSNFSNIQLGGGAANVAVALKLLGADVSVCTVLGDKSDPVTCMFENLLELKGIDLVCKYIGSAKTPNSLITVLPNGDRSITSYQPHDIVQDCSVDVDVSQYDIVMGDSYRLPLVSKLFKAAMQLSIPTMLDVDKTVTESTLLPFAEYVWFSQEAWQSFNNDVYKIYLQQVAKGTIGVTNGGNPILWLEPNGSVFQSFKPKAVNVVNSLGAGDVFRASLALQLSLKIPLATAIERACESAGEHISGKQLTKII